jgi:hypothetical protein
MTDAPIIASPDDIDRALATRAFSGTSFSPEERGQSRRNDYAATVNGFYAELWPLATTDDMKATLATEMERYRQGLISMTNAYLHSRSNVVSTMIAGPANFPVHRQQKLGDRAHKKLEGLVEWNERAQAAVRRKLLDARPEEVKADQEWQMLKRDLQSSLETIEAIDAGAAPYSRPLIVSNMAGKVERLAANGEAELVNKALQLVREYNETHDKPAISDRHSFWTFGQAAEAKADRLEAAAASGPQLIAEKEGVKVVADAADDRVRIVFAAKPDVQMIARLKGEAWKWSPSNCAWQRKLTANAKESARRIIGF